MSSLKWIQLESFKLAVFFSLFHRRCLCWLSCYRETVHTNFLLKRLELWVTSNCFLSNSDCWSLKLALIMIEPYRARHQIPTHENGTLIKLQGTKTTWFRKRSLTDTEAQRDVKNSVIWCPRNETGLYLQKWVMDFVRHRLTWNSFEKGFCDQYGVNKHLQKTYLLTQIS